MWRKSVYRVVGRDSGVESAEIINLDKYDRILIHSTKDKMTIFLAPSKAGNEGATIFDGPREQGERLLNNLLGYLGTYIIRTED